ncbi:hypothetical protein ACOME3_000309 [Neoechinorhynchus agilis]
MSGIHSKFDVEIEEQCPIETKSKSSFEDGSCKEISRKRLSSTIQGEVSLSEIRQSGLIDVLGEMLDNKDNAPLKKLLIQVAMKVKEAFNQKRSKEGRATKPKLNKPKEVEPEISDTDSSDRDSNAISDKENRIAEENQ